MGPNLFDEIFPNTTVDTFLRDGWAERPLVHHAASLSRLPQLQALGNVNNIVALLTATPERGQPAPNVSVAALRPGYGTGCLGRYACFMLTRLSISPNQ
jgi:hypothetical protein